MLNDTDDEVLERMDVREPAITVIEAELLANSAERGANTCTTHHRRSVCGMWLRLTCFALLGAASLSRAHGQATEADLLLQNRDLNASPATDFFQYANGGWLARNPMPDSEREWGINTLVRDNLNERLRQINEAAVSAPAGSDASLIGNFYSTALNEEKAKTEGIDPIADPLRQIARAKDLKNTLDVAFHLIQMNVPVLIGVTVAADQKDTGTNALYLMQVALGLPNRKYYLDQDPELEQVRKEYLGYIRSALDASGHNASDSAARAAKVVEFERTLARGSRSLSDLRDPLKNYNRMSPTSLTRDHTPHIQWTKHLKVWNVSPAYVVVGQPEYFETLDQLVTHVPLELVKDYLRFHLLAAYAQYLTPELEAAHFQMYGRVLTGQTQMQPRWMRIMDVENSRLMRSPADLGVINPIGMLVGKEYVRTYFPPSARARYTQMIQNLKDCLEERIRRLDWMSEPTRQQALEKLSKLTYQVGHPDPWPDYSRLRIGRTSYCDNMLSIARWAFNARFSQVGHPVNRNEWAMTPQTFNEYYVPEMNEMVVPAANFLIPGVAESDVDDALAYGYVGAELAHEITHGFDDEGRHFDAKGNLRDWWLSDDAYQFNQRAAKLVEQFNGYEPLPGLHIDGKATLGENIADLGGLLIARQAFMMTNQALKGQPINGLTPDQRFFLGYALAWMTTERPESLRQEILSDVHSPSRWRVNGPLSANSDFHRAFNIPAGTPMWLPEEQRARIW
jgi:putative endopeptidase